MKLLKAILLFILISLIGGAAHVIETRIELEWINFDYIAGLLNGFFIFPHMMLLWDEFWIDRRLKRLQQKRENQLQAQSKNV